ncbi:54S ribosomal protein L17, mitochondrial [Frankliniella fusca]|uniref:54S ribosomal protein L17, mitochondrial n=1 Tax=Frankliniella fusca TaxID=407009 RepID=A0AAE1H5U6_9NEOP|nr:54S ribosomal protein L17, mitochondrial [Frankliniella fusca]
MLICAAAKLKNWYCRDCEANNTQRERSFHDQEKLASVQEENQALMLQIQDLQATILKAEENKTILLKDVINMQNVYDWSLNASITSLKEKKEQVELSYKNSSVVSTSKICQTESNVATKDCQTDQASTVNKMCQTEGLESFSNILM